MHDGNSMETDSIRKAKLLYNIIDVSPSKNKSMEL